MLKKSIGTTSLLNVGLTPQLRLISLLTENETIDGVTHDGYGGFPVQAVQNYFNLADWTIAMLRTSGRVVLYGQRIAALAGHRYRVDYSKHWNELFVAARVQFFHGTFMSVLRRDGLSPVRRYAIYGSSSAYPNAKVPGKGNSPFTVYVRVDLEALLAAETHRVFVRGSEVLLVPSIETMPVPVRFLKFFQPNVTLRKLEPLAVQQVRMQ